MLGALDADWMIEIELSIRRVYCERIDWRIVRCMQQPGESRQGKRKRSVCSHPKVAHMPLNSLIAPSKLESLNAVTNVTLTHEA